MKKVLVILITSISFIACQKQVDISSKNLTTVSQSTGPVVPIDIPKYNCKVLHVTVKPFRYPKTYSYLSGLSRMFQYIDYDSAGRPVKAHYEYDYNYFTIAYDSRGNLSRINVYFMNENNLVRVFDFTHTGGIGNNYSSAIAVQEYEVVNGQQSLTQNMTFHYDNQYRIIRADLKNGQQKYWYYYNANGNLDRIEESAWAASPKPYLRFLDYDNMRSPNSAHRVWQILSGYHYINNPGRIQYHEQGSGVVRTQRYTYTYYNFYSSILTGPHGNERMTVFTECK